MQRFAGWCKTKNNTAGNYMQSFGVWCKTKDNTADNAKIQKFQINLWDLKKNGLKNQKPFIDFGIEISNLDELEQIIIYIPFKIDLNHLVDLSDKVSNIDTARLLFNDDNYNSSTESDFVYLKHGEKKILLFPFMGDKYTEPLYKLEDKYGGSLLSFYLHNIFGKNPIVKDKNLYIRFRLNCKEIRDMLFCKIEKKNLYLESGFTALQVVDVKINKKRNLPLRLCKFMENSNFKFATFSNIHFFIMEKAQNDVISLSDDFGDCRTLENEQWRNYLDNINPPKRVMVYHNKNVEGKSDYSFVAKIVEPTAKWSIIILYVIIMILLGMVSSYLYDNLPNFLLYIRNLLDIM